MNKPANRNLFWAQTLVDELARAGLGSICIAPGSRSTPLALAFADQDTIPVYMHPDERGAAFFALGQALASGRPAAILCTSGTAAANFFPAIVEAHLVHAPLLVLTADRPGELRDSGSNQTIDQVKMYGGFVRWAVDVAAPEAAPTLASAASLRTLACRALACAQGLPPGPVHLNLPFRKPLEPEPVPGDVPDRLWSAADGPALARPAGQPFVRLERGRLVPSDEQVEALLEAIGEADCGLIYCGPRCPGGEFPVEVLKLAEITGFPLLADALSGLRFRPGAPVGTTLLGGYETYLKSPALRKDLAPDLILQFGALPVSTSLTETFSAWRSARRVLVDGFGAWADDVFTTSDVLWADPASVCQELNERLLFLGSSAPDLQWTNAWQMAERLAWQAIDEAGRDGFHEGQVLAETLAALQPGDALFVGASLPVRHLDQFGRPASQGIAVYSNRGASGIDGTLASAAGVAASGAHRRVVLVLGDLTFFHDLNSLLALRNYAPNLTVVVINNDGGGIFQRLPVAQYEPPFTRLFRVPHGLQFGPAADLFHLTYLQTDALAPFQQAVRSALQSTDPQGDPQIIEVQTNAAQLEQRRGEIQRRFNALWLQAFESNPEAYHNG